MGIFADDREVYDTLGRLFVDIVADVEVAAGLQRANTVLRCEYSQPDAVVTLDLRVADVPSVDLGASEMEPEVTMSMTADTGHHFWLGSVNVTVALARGQMQTVGPVGKILRIVPLTKSIFPRYREQLLAQGRADLARV